MPAPFDPASYTDEAKRSWSSAAPFYDRLSADLFPPITDAFLSFLSLKPRALALDVACGPAALTRAAAKAVGPSGRVVGVDLSPGMIKLAASRAPAPNIEFREMNAERLDFPDEIFDAVFCQLGLMLFARPRAALREMARVCKKQGTVACLVQGSPERMLFTSLLMKALLKHAPEIKQPGAPGLYAFAPAGALEQALTEAGLGSVVSARLSGTFLFDSPAHFWTALTEGAGRTGSLLRALSPAARASVQAETLAGAARFSQRGKTAIPYEVVMARAKRV